MMSMNFAHNCFRDKIIQCHFKYKITQQNPVLKIAIYLRIENGIKIDTIVNLLNMYKLFTIKLFFY